MQHSKLIESFSTEDEHFFGSYEAAAIDAEGPLTLELDSVEPRPSTAEQQAHFTRFRRPVAWVMAAMGSLSLAALGQHGFQQSSRRQAAAHVEPATTRPTSAAAKNFASAGTKLPALADSATWHNRPSLVNDFTSALLSMCRDARS